jgi:signal peptide peptidase SppA
MSKPLDVDMLQRLSAMTAGLPDLISEFGMTAHMLARSGRVAGERLFEGGLVERRGAVAIFNVNGVLSADPQWYDEISTARLTAELHAALEDDEIASGMLLINSPGGHSLGMIELAKAAADFAAAKPLVAQVSQCCCSGAYWLASQAREIYAGPRDNIGSISAYNLLYDYSKMFAEAGVEAVLSKTGPLKAVGIIGTEITAEHREWLQERANTTMKDFAAAVRRGRKLTAEEFSAVSDGRYWYAHECVPIKLIDGIRSPHETLAGLLNGGAKPKGRTKTMDAPVAATLAELEKALPKASAEFQLQQLKAGATLTDAVTAYANHLAAENERLAGEAASEKARADSAEAAAKTNAGKQEPGKPVVGLGANIAGESAAAPLDYYELARQYQEKHKCRWSEACLEIKRRHPEAREAMGAPAKPRE